MEEYLSLINQESISQSKFSPSVVSKEEEVSRVLFLPKHLNDNELNSAAFEQILTRDGLSVLRNSYDFEKDLKTTVKIKCSNGVCEYGGYATAQISRIRNVVENQLRLFYILDTACADRRGHADVYSTRNVINHPQGNKWITFLVRKKIFDLFATNITYA